MLLRPHTQVLPAADVRDVLRDMKEPFRPSSLYHSPRAVCRTVSAAAGASSCSNHPQLAEGAAAVQPAATPLRAPHGTSSRDAVLGRAPSGSNASGSAVPAPGQTDSSMSCWVGPVQGVASCQPATAPDFTFVPLLRAYQQERAWRGGQQPHRHRR